MPVVITDFTNKVWAIEQPSDGFIHVGWAGQSGPRLLDVLEFIQAHQKQFQSFVDKKRKSEVAPDGKKNKGVRQNPEPAIQLDDVLTTEG